MKRPDVGAASGGLSAAILIFGSMWVASLSALDSASRSPSHPPSHLPSHPVVVGYFPQWGVYSQYFVKNFVESGAAGVVDQLDYSQAMIANNHCVIGDARADIDLAYTAANSLDGKADEPTAPLRGNFHQLQQLKLRDPQMTMLISIEGKAESFAVAARPENRVAFVSSCIEMFTRGHLAPGVEAGRLFDGFDLDWEYPLPADKDNYAALLAEFRRQMDAEHRGLKLTIATAAAFSYYGDFDMRAIAALVDQINVMNYDYNGPWSHTTGLIAPLYEIPGDPLQGNTVDASIQAYEKAGVPPSKLLLGVPLYAYGWSGVADVNHGLFQAGQPIEGEHFYPVIQSIRASTAGAKFKLYRDAPSQTPWLYDGTTLWTFDDPVSIAAKMNYARQHQLGGVMVWELSNDTADAGLVKTIAARLRDSSTNH